MAAIRKLKTMPSDPTGNPRVERNVHLLWLTPQPDGRAADVLPGVFMRQILIHILGIRLVFWPMNGMGVLFSTSGPRPEGQEITPRKFL